MGTDLVGGVDRWCILRCSGSKTLSLARSLAAAGFDVWTPVKTFKRPRPSKRLDGRRHTVEVDAPILPTFIFARATDCTSLFELATKPASQHPAFSMFQHAGRIPLIGDREVGGLRLAERAAAIAIHLQRDAETREEADRIRIAALRTEQARMKAMRMAEAERRKALRAERRDFAAGEHVTIDDMPALTGVTGVVESSDGRNAMVIFGSRSWKIEAWRLAHDGVMDAQS